MVMPWITLAPSPTAVARPMWTFPPVVAPGAEAGVIGDHPVVVDRGPDAEQHAPADPAAVADDHAGEDDAAGTDGRVVAHHRGRVDDRCRRQVWRGGGRALEEAAARRVVADGDDEVVGARLRRARDEIGVGAEDGHTGHVVAAASERSSTPTGSWSPPVTMASSTCRPWSDPPITMRRVTTGSRGTAPSSRDRAR